MAITIKDVARETNLSISTISKYMNGGNVKEENRIKIEEAINKLGFVPNDVARGLRTFRTYTVGLLMGGASSQHTATIISEAQRILKSKGYSLAFIPLDPTERDTAPHQMKKYIDYLVNRGVDGLIVTYTKRREDFFQSTREKNIPVVLLEERSTKYDSVMVDCTGSSYEIVEYLINKGHRKIGVIAGQKGKLTADERCVGYKRVMEDYGIPIREDYIIEGDFTAISGYEAMKKLWSMKDRPTAVFATNYEICLGAMEAIRDMGIRIPEELSFAAFDDFNLSIIIRPHLTAVRQPVKEIAKEACELLCRRMNGDYKDFPKMIRLKAECFYRDSVRDL